MENAVLPLGCTNDIFIINCSSTEYIYIFLKNEVRAKE